MPRAEAMHANFSPRGAAALLPAQKAIAPERPREGLDFHFLLGEFDFYFEHEFVPVTLALHFRFRRLFEFESWI